MTRYDRAKFLRFPCFLSSARPLKLLTRMGLKCSKGAHPTFPSLVGEETCHRMSIEDFSKASPPRLIFSGLFSLWPSANQDGVLTTANLLSYYRLENLLASNRKSCLTIGVLKPNMSFQEIIKIKGTEFSGWRVLFRLLSCFCLVPQFTWLYAR